MFVNVRENNVDQALKALKRKIQKNGILRDIRLRVCYEKPSVKLARKKAEAIKRNKKLQRKKQDIISI